MSLKMMKQNSSRGNNRSVGERLLISAMSSSSSDDERTTPQVTLLTNATTTTSHSTPFPFGQSSLSPPPPTSLPTTTTPTTDNSKTGIGARLDAAVAAAKPVNRSADLVPLTQDYYKMKKQLQTLTNAARFYLSSMIIMNEARRKVRILSEPSFCSFLLYLNSSPRDALSYLTPRT
jgi:hypothetical protein